jgi:molybdopterin-synthase adenylyltransferase
MVPPASSSNFGVHRVMALREDQIQRYSRQIVLKEVGGRGQERLLAAVVWVEGESLALDVAVAALGASGTPLLDGAHAQRTGFLAGTTLGAMSPDAVAAADRSVAGWLGPISKGSAAPVNCFRVGISAGCIVGVPAGAHWPQSSPSPASAEPVTTGSLAALVVQRFALGLDVSPVTLRWVSSRWQRD